MKYIAERIAVFGSWRAKNEQDRAKGVRNLNKAWSNKNNRDVFENACRKIGSEIARSGHQVLIASESQSTVDYHIVQGIFDSEENLKINKPPIHVIRSQAPLSSKSNDDCSKIMKNAISDHPALFDEPEFFKGEKWEQVHDYIAEIADKILIIGGGASTHRIANRALASGKLVVPIGTFGGAGEELIRMLKNVRDQSALPKYDYRKVLADPIWKESLLNTCLYALGIRKDPKVRRKVFINYRRDDSNTSAYLIRSHLRNELDDDEVFLDHESIEAGSRFEDVIISELNKTKVFLCLVGPSWLKIHDNETGKRRLDMEGDFVRREIEVAIRDGIHIIPVCVEGASIPKKTSLPNSINSLPDFNASFISQDNIEEGITKLVNTIYKHLKNEA